MDNTMTKTVVVFDRPFKMPGFDETLPAGEYDIETELASPPDHRDPEAWKASVMIHLHPRVAHPGLTRSLLVSLVDFDNARARDKLTGKQVSEVFLEEMLADPMVQLIMRADGVSEAQLRHLFWHRGQRRPIPISLTRSLMTKAYSRSQEKAHGTMSPKVKGRHASRAVHHFSNDDKNAFSIAIDGEVQMQSTEDDIDMDEPRRAFDNTAKARLALVQSMRCSKVFP